jgi:hypothetical protein
MTAHLVIAVAMMATTGLTSTLAEHKHRACRLCSAKRIGLSNGGQLTTAARSAAQRQGATPPLPRRQSVDGRRWRIASPPSIIAL